MQVSEEYKNIEKVHDDGVTAWYIGEKNGEWFTWDDLPDGAPQYIGDSREEAVSTVHAVMAFWEAEFGE